MNFTKTGGEKMAETKDIIIAIVGYILGFISPIIGIIAGIIIYFTQKENPFLKKQGLYIIVFAIIVWIISIILITQGLYPSFSLFSK